MPPQFKDLSRKTRIGDFPNPKIDALIAAINDSAAGDLGHGSIESPLLELDDLIPTPKSLTKLGPLAAGVLGPIFTKIQKDVVKKLHRVSPGVLDRIRKMPQRVEIDPHGGKNISVPSALGQTFRPRDYVSAYLDNSLDLGPGEADKLADLLMKGDVFPRTSIKIPRATLQNLDRDGKRLTIGGNFASATSVPLHEVGGHALIHTSKELKEAVKQLMEDPENRLRLIRQVVPKKFVRSVIGQSEGLSGNFKRAEEAFSLMMESGAFKDPATKLPSARVKRFIDEILEAIDETDISR